MSVFPMLRPVANVVKLFTGNLEKSKFPPKVKQQKWAILKAISNLTVYFCFRHQDKLFDVS